MYMKPYLQYLFYPKTVLVPSFSWTSRIDKSHFGADIAIQWYGAASSCHPERSEGSGRTDDRKQQILRCRSE